MKLTRYVELNMYSYTEAPQERAESREGVVMDLYVLEPVVCTG